MNDLKTVYVFLADKFEEIEAVTPIDVLRRAGVKVITVGVQGEIVTGAHNIVLKADVYEKSFELPADADMVLFPGGAGVNVLRKSPLIEKVLKKAVKKDILVAAICAAPLLLHDYGLLDNKRATAFPSVQKELPNAHITDKAVERDGKIITARSAGSALIFSYELIVALLGEPAADEALATIYPTNVLIGIEQGRKK